MSRTPSGSSRTPSGSGRVGLVVIFVIALIIGAYDVYAAVQGRGQKTVAWVLAAIMLLIAIGSLRKLLRRDYSNTWW